MSKLKNDKIGNFDANENKNNAHKRSRNWFFTINNHTKEDIKKVKDLAIKYDYEYVMQEEIEEEKGTPQIHITLNREKKFRFKQLKKLFPRAKIRQCKSLKRSIKYYTETQTRIGGPHTNIKGLKWKEALITKYKGWQLELVKLINESYKNKYGSDVIWVADAEGGKGKSFFARNWLRLNYNKTCLVSGKASDIKNDIAKKYNDGENEIEYVFIDISRSMEIKNDLYIAAGSVRDGCFFPDKYKGYEIDLVRNPVVVILSNQMPDIGKLSKGRFKILDLNMYQIK